MISRHMVAVVLTAACALSASAQNRNRDRDRDRDDADRETRVDTVLPLGRNGSIEVQLHSGDVIVTGWNRSEVRIVGTSERGQLRIESTASHIDIGGRMSRGHMGETRVELSVPQGTRVTIANHSGDVSVRGVRGEIDVGTTSGDVLIEDATSRVSFNSVSGDVQVMRVDGVVRGESMSGSVTVHEASGEVDVESVSGDLMVRTVQSRSVRLETVSGTVEYEGRTENGGRYDFASHSGDVRLVLPASLGALIAVETFSGTIDSDFPITLQPGQRHGKQFEFQVGDGGARIDASSFSGGIYLQRGGSRDRE